MTKPKPPDGDDLSDMAHVLPPPVEDEPTPEQKRRRAAIPATPAGLLLAAQGAPWDAVLDADEAQNAAWGREAEQAREAAAKAREQIEKRRELDLIERRLRVQRAARREARSQQGGTSS
jgi:hypothetical protein